MHGINSFTIIIPAKTVIWMSAIYEKYNNDYYRMKKSWNISTDIKINIF